MTAITGADANTVYIPVLFLQNPMNTIINAPCALEGNF